MTEMFGLLKKLTTSRTHKKVLIREEAKFPVIKNVNSISIAREEEERSDMTDVTPDNTEMRTETKKLVKEAEMNNEAESEPMKKKKRQKFNDSLSRTRARKTKRKTYDVSPKGPVYKAILRKRITRKEDIGGNFEIPCNIGGQKGINALVDQGSDVNVMPYSTYMKLTDEKPAETDIRLSLASHSYIYPLGIAEDVLVEVAEHVYPVDFIILDIKEDEKRPFILGTPFSTTAKASIKFDKGTITLRSKKSKISFHRIPESSCKIEKGVKNDIEPIAPIMTVNRLVLEWEERIKLHLEKEIKFNQWRSNNFKSKHPAPIKVEGGMDDDGEVTRNHVRKFLRALPTKWCPKVTVIKESKDLSTLPLDELIGNLKVYEVVLENDLEISKNKKEKYKSLALKARKVLSEEEVTSSDSDDEEYVMAEKDDRRCYKCGDPNHFISDCPKHSFNDQKAFVVACWSDSGDDSKKEEICLMALDNNEVRILQKSQENGQNRTNTNTGTDRVYKSREFLAKHTTPKKWDCQLGNPCAHILIQRSQLRIQSLEGIKGQDQKLRGACNRPRSFLLLL
ncbi:zinc finger, CCHC-type containing protein [Tanacetum coccineum]